MPSRAGSSSQSGCPPSMASRAANPLSGGTWCHCAASSSPTAGVSGQFQAPGGRHGVDHHAVHTCGVGECGPQQPGDVVGAVRTGQAVGQPGQDRPVPGAAVARGGVAVRARSRGARLGGRAGLRGGDGGRRWTGGDPAQRDPALLHERPLPLRGAAQQRLVRHVLRQALQGHQHALGALQDGRGRSETLQAHDFRAQLGHDPGQCEHLGHGAVARRRGIARHAPSMSRLGARHGPEPMTGWGPKGQPARGRRLPCPPRGCRRPPAGCPCVSGPPADGSRRCPGGAGRPTGIPRRTGHRPPRARVRRAPAAARRAGRRAVPGRSPGRGPVRRCRAPRPSRGPCAAWPSRVGAAARRRPLRRGASRRDRVRVRPAGRPCPRRR